MVGRPDRVFTFLLLLVLVWLCGILGFLYQSRHSEDSLTERHFQSLYGGPQFFLHYHMFDNKPYMYTSSQEHTSHEDEEEMDRNVPIAAIVPADTNLDRGAVALSKQLAEEDASFHKAHTHTIDASPRLRKHKQRRKSHHSHRSTPASSGITGNASPKNLLSVTECDVISPIGCPAIVVITYNRPKYLEQTLHSLRKAAHYSNFVIYISQDGSTPDLTELASSHHIELLHHNRHPDLVPDQKGTAYLAQHYRFVFETMFEQKNHSHVIVIEDDLIVSSDFLLLFEDTAPLLDVDDTLWCISSWNDHGMTRYVHDPTRLFRTDIFPGLGWMMKRDLWLSELRYGWPLDQWDHWMRQDTISKGRECIAPEIARNHNIGEEGTTMNKYFFQNFLEAIAFHKGEPVEFSRQSHLSHLFSSRYEKHIQSLITSATHLGHSDDSHVIHTLKKILSTKPETNPTHNILITYQLEDYPVLAAALVILSAPRASHRGVTILRHGAQYIFLVDTKISPYLPTELQFERDPTLRALPSLMSESCTSACHRHNLTCSRDHFQYINRCSELQKIFPCTKGCRGGVDGLDIPNYANSTKKPDLYQQCLTNDVDIATCDASHWSGARLCPCVKPTQ